MDVQGAPVAKPYVQKAGVTFPVAVDTADVLGQAFGLKAIPVSIFVDEVGIVRLRGGGPSVELLSQIEELLQEPVTRIRGTAPQLATAVAHRNWSARSRLTPTIGGLALLWLVPTPRPVGATRLSRISKRPRNSSPMGAAFSSCGAWSCSSTGRRTPR